jgi:hypothetical protein
VNVIRKGLIKRIHVNRQTIDRNRKQGLNDPVLTVQHSKGPSHGKNIVISCQHCGNDVAVMSQERKQLSCGARVYIETLGEVIVK